MGPWSRFDFSIPFNQIIKYFKLADWSPSCRQCQYVFIALPLELHGYGKLSDIYNILEAYKKKGENPNYSNYHPF